MRKPIQKSSRSYQRTKAIGCCALVCFFVLGASSPSFASTTDSLEDSSSEEHTGQTSETDTQDGTKFFDFRCIHDGDRVNAEINYNREGRALPKRSTLKVELEQAGCEILGNDEGGKAHCRCSSGQLETYEVSAASIPTLIHGTDDIEALLDMCRDAVRARCGVEPKDPDWDDTEEETDDSSSGGDFTMEDDSSTGDESSTQDSTSSDDAAGNGSTTEQEPDENSGTSGGQVNDVGSGSHDADSEPGRIPNKLPSLPAIQGCRSGSKGSWGMMGVLFFFLIRRKM